MIKVENKFSNRMVAYYFDASFSFIDTLADKHNCILLTDKNIAELYQSKFSSYKTIVIEAGEAFKQQYTVDTIIQQLIELGADRKTTLVGIGGGVVTDITGYVASVYMRGIDFAFVPTTILAMVDAAIGGKNGIDVGVYKNMVGTINQPKYLLYDFSFLETLPNEQWINGFAEIIKHACIKDALLFQELENNTLDVYKTNKDVLVDLIKKNATLKTDVVVKDEYETSERKLLNFGHTFGHAIENLYQLPHGHAISIGMVIAAKISEEINNLYSDEKERLTQLLQKYGLPIQLNFDKEKVLSILKMDKKRVKEEIDFILLNNIGEAVIMPISLTQVEDLVNQIL
ncbi:MAG: 3-dehydroquinate synthase [Chitinophagaceae bacterium]|nr:3-dehydroquinate synthase [Chitinophagaceae bacterium]